MSWFTKLLELIFGFFKKKPPQLEEPTLPTELPYPEEPPDYTKTLENISVEIAITDWLVRYKVPFDFWGWWRDEGVVIKLTLEIPFPAGTYELDGKRYLQMRPEWSNPGVIAHEQAHNSYALLTEGGKVSFEGAYNSVQSDPYIVLLHSKNTYMDELDVYGRHVEGHAEVYRFLGDRMPIDLKRHYPKLFKEV